MKSTDDFFASFEKKYGPYEVEGQMSIFDFPEFLPDSMKDEKEEEEER